MPDDPGSAGNSGISRQELAVESVRQSLARYSSWEPHLHAFSWMEPDVVMSRARDLDRISPDARGALHGIPVGIKDIFDTAGIATEYGSPIFKGRVPEKSALAVTQIEKEGALLFGKTVTAELAYYAPGPTTNPWNPLRTPGGSSMGSAAAVAAGVVPLAVGSQTNGSVIRPAAFCGVVGFKPTARRLPTQGVLRFSPSLDQLGVFSRSVDGASRIAAAIAGGPPTDWASMSAAARSPKFGVVRTREWHMVEHAAQAHFDSVVDGARAAGASVEDLDLPTALEQAIPVHRTIMAAEAHRFVGPLVEARRDQCSSQLLALLSEGAAISRQDYEAALAIQLALTDAYAHLVDRFDAILTPPALGEAPSIETTGDPRFCTGWTLVGAPALTLPTGLGPNGLPLGTQLVGQIGGDRDLIAAARWLELVHPGPGNPPQPGQERR